MDDNTLLIMRRLILRSLLILLILELAFRIIIDPLYFYQIDTYTLDKSGYNFKNLYLKNNSHDNKEIDYLFIGSSRIPAAIDVSVIMNYSDSIVAVNAGRGYLTGSINYWALKNKLDKNPDYLKGTTVITELQGASSFIYSQNFDKTKFSIHPQFPHLILPHVTNKILFNNLFKTDYDFGLKVRLFFLHNLSLYRTIPFLKSKLQELVFSNNNSALTNEGGIKTDETSIQNARTLVTQIAKQRIRNHKELFPLKESDLENSMFAELHKIIIENGGNLILIDMPLHSVQQAVFETEYNRKNSKVFHKWLQKNNIPIIRVKDFSYNDEDFPDYGHLGTHKREEFTRKVYNQVLKVNNEMD